MTQTQTASFGFEARLTRDTGWRERVMSHADATVTVRQARFSDGLASFIVYAARVGEYGVVDDTAFLDKYEYIRTDDGLAATPAACRPLSPATTRDPDYSSAARAAASAAAPSVQAFWAAARRNGVSGYPWAWRPFEPSREIRRFGWARVGKVTKGGQFDAEHGLSEQAGRERCIEEAMQYRIVGDEVWRLSGEPVWAVPLEGPPRVLALCDHSVPLLNRPEEHLFFAADAPLEAARAARLHHGCNANAVAVIGDIQVGAGVAARFCAPMLTALFGLHRFIAASNPVAAYAPSDMLRIWTEIRETALDHPDPKLMSRFLSGADAVLAGRIRRLCDAARAITQAIRRSGLVDDTRLEPCLDACETTERMMERTPGGKEFMADHDAGIAMTDVDAIGALVGSRDA